MDILAFMDALEKIHPTTGDNADDGRCAYPQRWEKLKDYLKEKRAYTQSDVCSVCKGKRYVIKYGQRVDCADCNGTGKHN